MYFPKVTKLAKVRVKIQTRSSVSRAQLQCFLEVTNIEMKGRKAGREGGGQRGRKERRGGREAGGGGGRKEGRPCYKN